MERWEAHVETLLAKHPQLLKAFLYDPPPKQPSLIAASLFVLTSPLQKRLERRLTALEQIVEVA